MFWPSTLPNSLPLTLTRVPELTPGLQLVQRATPVLSVSSAKTTQRRFLTPIKHRTGYHRNSRESLVP